MCSGSMAITTVQLASPSRSWAALQYVLCTECVLSREGKVVRLIADVHQQLVCLASPRGLMAASS